MFRFSRSILAAAGALVLGLSLCSHTRASDAPTTRPTPATLRIAVYNDGGAPDRSFEFVQKCLENQTAPSYDIKRINGKDVRDGVLKDIDVAVFPGGSGSGQAKSLEDSGRDKVRDFVRAGGGYLGICGGSYLASADYPWSLNILNSSVVDRKHWARGRAVLKLNLTPAGKDLLGESKDQVDCLYHQGPLMAPGKLTDVAPYEPMATFGTEVAENGAPPGVMLGTTAIARGFFGKGHVVCISPHPEQTSGLEGYIRHSIIWTATAAPAPSTQPTQSAAAQ